MEARRALDRLTMHQQRIRVILATARVALHSDSADDIKTLALTRWELMRALREYQLFKHIEIFDPLIAHGNPARGCSASQLKSRCVAIALSYQTHVEQWGWAAQRQDWKHYKADVLAMADRIAAHLDQEAAGVTRLLAGVRRTRIGTVS